MHKNSDTAQPIRVLQTYDEQPSDGLSTVYHRVASLGAIVADTSMLKNTTVLVPGIPPLYLNRLSTQNRNVCYTTFESTRIPLHWTSAINNFYSACCVPHESVRRAFVDSGVKVRVHVVQQGYNRYPGSTVSPPPDHLCRVGFLGVPTLRKNLHLLVQACEELLDERYNLQLVVHVPHYYDWMQTAQLKKLAAKPYIEWTEGRKTSQQLADWFGSLGCYAYPSSGEGWSFTPRESLSLGVPTLVSDIPVHKELIESGYVIPIKSHKHTPAIMETSATGQWCQIESQDIVVALRYLLQNRQITRSSAQQGAQWIADQWLNDNCCSELLKLLRSL